MTTEPMKSNLILLLSAALALSISCSSFVEEEPSGQQVAGVKIVENFKSNILVTLEDSSGIEWILSTSAVLSFDGENYLCYSSQGDATPNVLTSMILDSSERLWIGKQQGIDLIGKERTSSRHFSIQGYNNFICGLFEWEGGVYAFTPRDLFRFNEETETFEYKLSFNPEWFRPSSCLIDGRGNVWSFNREGYECFSPGGELLSKGELGNMVNPIGADASRSVFMIAGGQLHIYDSESFSRVPLPSVLSPINDKLIRSASMCGNHMVLLTSDGLYCYDTLKQTLSSDNDESFPFSPDIPYDRISRIWGDSKGNLWYMDSEGTHHKAGSRGSESPYVSILSHIDERNVVGSVYDRNFLWILMDGSNLLTYRLSNGEVISVDRLSSGRDATGVEILPDGNLSVSFPGRIMTFSITEEGKLILKRDIRYSGDIDRNRNITEIRETGLPDGTVVGAGIGSAIYEGIPSSDGTLDLSMVKEITSLTSSITATNMTTLRDGRIAIAYSDLGVALYDPSSKDAEIIDLADTDHGQVYISSMLESRSGDLWIGCNDKGLFRYGLSSGTLKEYNGLGGVWKLYETAGTLFIQTIRTLYRYDSREDSFTAVWNDPSDFSGFKMMVPFPDGTMISFNGGAVLNASSAKEDLQKSLSSPVHIVIASGKDVLHEKVLSPSADSEEIRWKSMPENVSIYISLIDHSDNYTPVEYKINGRPKEFRSSYRGSFPLDGLGYGKNPILFRFRSPSTMETSPEYRVAIKMRIPWQIVMGGFLAILFLGALAVLLVQWIKKRKEVEEARHEKETQEAINMGNLDFFANISHEFRTPLTLISGAIESLDGEANIPEQKRMKGVIKRNTDRMLKLVSQLLDFNKMDHGMLSLSTEAADAVSILTRTVEQFQFGAGKKDIDLNLFCLGGSLLMWVDSDKFEKILYNLLSNAVKYTPPGGKIEVAAMATDGAKAMEEFSPGEEPLCPKYLKVSVSDTGIGIPEDKKDFIFERFARVDPAHKSGGTGIGLYFTRSLVEMHHGKIHAGNRTDLEEGKTGSVFSFILPMDQSAYSDSEKTPAVDTAVSLDSSEHKSEYTARIPEVPENIGKPKILVIDDDYEIVYFLKSLLSSEYQVLCRFDAMSGYALIGKEQPELVISDVMMDDVDGFQLCSMVKQDINISHIPVILLTAKSTLQDQIEGLNAGADAYVVKPFNNEYLLAVIKAQLENRRRVKNMFNTSTDTLSISKTSLPEMDRILMDKLYSLMESSLEEGEINLDEIAHELNFSRSKFYAKIKDLTGQTPNDFFNVYKLNRAAQLIGEGKYKISAIANMVGFSSSSHFALLFKKQFGVLPSQYIAKNTDK
ncbi:MAG: response regulator [Bacteroidales bacterium]|nr:response regulator [Bacteroidales bacterium]